MRERAAPTHAGETASGNTPRRRRYLGNAERSLFSIQHSAVLLESLIHRVPVDDVPPRGEVVGPAVLVLQIVGMFPDIDAENRLFAFHQRAVLVRGALDEQLAAGVDPPRPAPAAALHPPLLDPPLSILQITQR